jgi:hypothetical protein
LLSQSTHSSVASSTSSRPSHGLDHFGLEKTEDRLGHRVAIRVANAYDRGFDASLGASLRA